MDDSRRPPFVAYPSFVVVAAVVVVCSRNFSGGRERASHVVVLAEAGASEPWGTARETERGANRNGPKPRV